MRAIKIVVGAVLLVAAAGLLLVRTCAYGGGMGAYQSCECRGIEWQLYDQRPADGPRKTLCAGIIASRTCYRFQGGPEMPCAP